MAPNEKKIFLETKLRNLRRKYAKLIQHADCMEEAIETKADIDAVERELKLI